MNTSQRDPNNPARKWVTLFGNLRIEGETHFPGQYQKHLT
jgi:hypothetical protein